MNLDIYLVGLGGAMAGSAIAGLVTSSLPVMTLVAVGFGALAVYTARKKR